MQPKAKNEIQKTELQIYKLKQKLVKLRAKDKKEPVKNYTLQFGPKKMKLSDLFGKHKEMILIHNMGPDCAYCTLWADGFTGFVPHLENRAAFIVENDEPIAKQAKFAKSRKWNFKLVSSDKTKLKDDLGFKDGDDYMPGVSALIKDLKGNIFRVAKTYFGPGDNFCAAWDFFDLLPAKEWSPKFKY